MWNQAADLVLVNCCARRTLLVPSSLADNLEPVTSGRFSNNPLD